MNKPPIKKGNLSDVIANGMIKTGIAKPLASFEKKVFSNSRAHDFATATTFASLSIGELIAIKTNKKTPEEKKKYLMPQALAEAGLNLVTLLGISKVFNSVGTNLVANGTVLPKNLRKAYEGKPGLLKEVVNAKPQNLTKLAEKMDKNVIENTRGFAKGMGMLTGTFVGLTLTINLVTPLLTNAFAKFYNKKYLNKNFTKNEHGVKKPAATQTPTKPGNTFKPNNKVIIKSSKLNNLYTNFNAATGITRI